MSHHDDVTGISKLIFCITPQGLHSKFIPCVSGKVCAVELGNLNIYYLSSIIVITSYHIIVIHFLLYCQFKYIVKGSKWTCTKYLLITESHFSENDFY